MGVLKSRWSHEEDETLLRLVSKHPVEGDEHNVSWVNVAAQIPGRTAKQCRERWKGVLDPSLNRSPLSIEELETIDRLLSKHGKSWSIIAHGVGNGRSELMIRNMYYARQRKHLRMGQQGEVKLAPGASKRASNTATTATSTLRASLKPSKHAREVDEEDEEDDSEVSEVESKAVKPDPLMADGAEALTSMAMSRHRLTPPISAHHTAQMPPQAFATMTMGMPQMPMMMCNIAAPGGMMPVCMVPAFMPAPYTSLPMSMMMSPFDWSQAYAGGLPFGAVDGGFEHPGAAMPALKTGMQLPGWPVASYPSAHALLSPSAAVCSPADKVASADKSSLEAAGSISGHKRHRDGSSVATRSLSPAHSTSSREAGWDVVV